GGGWNKLANRPGVIPGTMYLPSEIQKVSQTNKDAYVMLSFGKDQPIFGNVRLSGNIGLRYVNTKVQSAGAIFINRSSLGVDQDFAQRCPTNPTPPVGLPPGVTVGRPGGICLIGAAAYAQLQQFASGTATPNVANTNNDQFLPSLNLKFGLTRDLVMRFAASKVMTLPDLASIRNSFSATFNNADNTVTFNLGNPYLKPATAKQFDATLEWYFAKVGSLTVDAFYKEIDHFFFANQVTRSFTQNGITEPITVRVPSNYDGTGKIKGFEVAYQQSLDFLPWIFSGLGVNASYTYLNSKGLPNSFLNTGSPSNLARTGVGNLPLEQLSKHTVNLQAFYEKGPVSLRVAYNWRSRFLLTAADVIFPYYPIFNEASGNLDASAFFNVTKQLKFGVQAVNLLNTITKTTQQFTADGLSGPRSYYMNDRRFSFILRGNF
ncbi:MAG: TonB-dependent receptor, partial [Alphaproteobacteria bacterium]|nr:TonB-dependent receptor [Alphaproteobacteria bacterium]